jgi:hypothetical protein
MRLLDRHHPVWHARSVHERRVAASAAATFAAVRRLDLSRSAVARALFRLRGLPTSAMSLAGLERMRFTVLDEWPPHELALGVIGRFWTPRGALRRFVAEEYLAFSEPGYAKAAWGFEVIDDPTGTRLRTETRISGTDAASTRSFRLYWVVIAPFSGVIRREALRAIATDAESSARQPTTHHP